MALHETECMCRVWVWGNACITGCMHIKLDLQHACFSLGMFAHSCACAAVHCSCVCMHVRQKQLICQY